MDCKVDVVNKIASNGKEFEVLCITIQGLKGEIKVYSYDFKATDKFKFIKTILGR